MPIVTKQSHKNDFPITFNLHLQPSASTKTPSAYPAYVCIKPPRRDLVFAPQIPILHASKLDFSRAVEVSKANVITKEKAFESELTRLHFAQDAFRRQSPEVVRHAQDCQRVLGKDVLTRNLFAEAQLAEKFVMRAERSLRFQEDKLRRDEAEFAGEEGCEEKV